MERCRRVAITLEQCWHAVPGGTARAALGSVGALQRFTELDLVGVSARHRGLPKAAWVPTIPVTQLGLPRLALYESWHRLRRPSVERATGPVDVIHATGMAMPPPSVPIVATVHDVLVIVGFFSLSRLEFDLTALAAVLAIMGYSLNDTIVIFDRIRENFRRYRKMSTVEIINNAITSTISRTIITHGSTQLMVLSMLLFGGATLHYFALALTIGILFGIYSSVFVAAAIAMWLGIKREDLIKVVKKDGSDEDPNDPNAGAVV